MEGLEWKGWRGEGYSTGFIKHILEAQSAAITNIWCYMLIIKLGGEGGGVRGGKNMLQGYLGDCNGLIHLCIHICPAPQVACFSTVLV